MLYTISDFQKTSDKHIQNARNILKVMINKGHVSLGDIAHECGLSVPTTTKIVEELVRDRFVRDLGARHKAGGRMPNMFDLNPSLGYFAGVEINNSLMRLGIIRFDGELAYSKEDIVFDLTEDVSVQELAAAIREAVKDSPIDASSIMVYTISIPGRVNTHTMECLDYFRASGSDTARLLEEALGAKVYLDNDSRVMCYGEYIHSHLSDYRNVLYINLGWGLGMGMILDGHLFYGGTGFSGELGHVTMFDNEVFCRCGKKGCMETEVSGWAALRLLKAKHFAGARSILSPRIEASEKISAEAMVEAVKSGDMLMIEIIEEMGANLGRGIAAMVNVLNPQLVVFGGVISEAGDHLLMSTVSSLRKNSISRVNRETTCILGKTGRLVTVLGASYIARDRSLGIM